MVKSMEGQPSSRFKRGAVKSPPHKLLGAEPFVPTKAPTSPVAYVPATLRMWGNNQYGDCVTAEEGYAKDCHNPSILLDDSVIISWAEAHGVLNGADLASVLDAMVGDGFRVSGQQYNDGGKLGVDYSNEAILQAAIAQGPVKIAIDAGALPGDAGNKSGWYATGGSPGQYPNTDHCTSLGGFGTAQFLYQSLGLPLPTALRSDQQGYLHFTWSTLGFVDHAWLMSTCTEAWVRQPTTIGVPPLPDPVPPTPTPVPDPVPTPGPTLRQQIDAVFAAVEAQHGFVVKWVMERVRGLIDYYLDAHPQAQEMMGVEWPLPIPPAQLQVIIDALLVTLQGVYPQYAWLIAVAKTFIDTWLASQ